MGMLCRRRFITSEYFVFGRLNSWLTRVQSTKARLTIVSVPPGSMTRYLAYPC